jgi:hypothetical protein
MQQIGEKVDKGPNIVVCLSCGATKDWEEEDSCTCYECFDPEAQWIQKYNLARDLPRRADVERAREREKGDHREGAGGKGEEAVQGVGGMEGTEGGAGDVVCGKSEREREREQWLERERERANAGLTVEDLLPSSVFRSPPPPPLPPFKPEQSARCRIFILIFFYLYIFLEPQPEQSARRRPGVWCGLGGAAEGCVGLVARCGSPSE